MTEQMLRHAPRLLLLLMLLGLVGCGYSEDEMRAKVREVESLKMQLNAEAARNRQFQKDLDETRARVEQLKEQLSSMGVDFASMKNDMAEQARALAEYQKRAAQLEKIKARFDLLRRKLDALSSLGLKVVIRNNRMIIQLPGDVLFASGKETLKAEGEQILAKVATVINNDAALRSRQYQVAGHTDNRPYRMGIFKDNWGLSAMRAREVLAYLVDPDQGNLPRTHWSAAGYGDTDPLTKNDTPEGRQRNRRVELVVLPAIEEMLNIRSLVKAPS